jgi:hypothetical protein
MKRVLIVVVAFAIGCNGSQPSQPKTPQNSDSTSAAPAKAFPSAGKPSEEEAVASIREYFTAPGSGAGFLSVEIERISAPIDTPKEHGDTWAYSVSLKGESLVGGMTIHHKNWVVLVGREDGRTRVKDYYHTLERAANSPLGKDWWAKSGLPSPPSEEAALEFLLGQ